MTTPTLIERVRAQLWEEEAKSSHFKIPASVSSDDHAQWIDAKLDEAINKMSNVRLLYMIGHLQMLAVPAKVIKKPVTRSYRPKPDKARGPVYLEMYSLIHDYADMTSKMVARDEMRKALDVDLISRIPATQYEKAIQVFKRLLADEAAKQGVKP